MNSEIISFNDSHLTLFQSGGKPQLILLVKYCKVFAESKAGISLALNAWVVSLFLSAAAAAHVATTHLARGLVPARTDWNFHLFWV